MAEEPTPSWIEHAGRFANDPVFDEVRLGEEFRRQSRAEIPNYSEPVPADSMSEEELSEFLEKEIHQARAERRASQDLPDRASQP